MQPIRHAVWPTGVPPVTTGRWGQAEWERFEDGFRPADYVGGRHDGEAWRDYVAALEERRIASSRERSGFPPDPRGGDPLFGRVIHGDLRNAVREASARGPAVVAWVPVGRAGRTGWAVYDPAAPIPGIEPEILCPCRGALPIPLSGIGLEALRSAFGPEIEAEIGDLVPTFAIECNASGCAGEGHSRGLQGFLRVTRFSDSGY